MSAPSPSSSLRCRSRWKIAAVLALVVALGLPARTSLARHLPEFYLLYVGDGLYALAFALGFSFLFPHRPPLQIALITLLWCYGVEVSQLFAPAWPAILRQTKLGRLIMGYGFRWTDIVAYTLGVAAGIGLDHLWLWPAGDDSGKVPV